MVVAKEAIGTKVRSSADIGTIFRAIIQAERGSQDTELDADKEHWWAVGLNGAHEILYIDTVTLGLVDQCHCHPRESFRMAILKDCSAIIFGHNHPSGQLTPSPEDRDVSRRMKMAGEMLGVRVLDSIIVTAKGFYSLAEHDEL